MTGDKQRKLIKMQANGTVLALKNQEKQKQIERERLLKEPCELERDDFKELFGESSAFESDSYQ